MEEENHHDRSRSRSEQRSTHDSPNRKENVSEKEIQVEAKKKKSQDTVNTIIGIKRLTHNTNENHLREIFSNYGVVKRVRISLRDGTMLSQGIGFVEMSSVEEAKLAISYLDGSQIDGVKVFASQAYKSPFDIEEKKPEIKKQISHSEKRRQSRSRSRDRHGSRSHRRHSSREDSNKMDSHSHRRHHERKYSSNKK